MADNNNPSFKYGLEIRKKQPKRPLSLPNSKYSSSVFGTDDEDGIEAEIIREGMKKRSKKEIAQIHEDALASDASIFDYDGTYDEVKAAQMNPRVVEKSQRSSKYIGALLEKAKTRKIEQEIIYERMLTKERAKEDHLFGNKEKFVTRAYKAKLAEHEKWIQEEKRLSLLEEENDVTKKEDLSDFNRHILERIAPVGVNTEPPTVNPSIDPAAEDSTADEIGVHPLSVQGHSPELEYNRSGGSSAPAQEATEDDKAGERSTDKVAAARERYLARKKK